VGELESSPENMRFTTKYMLLSPNINTGFKRYLSETFNDRVPIVGSPNINYGLTKAVLRLDATLLATKIALLMLCMGRFTLQLSRYHTRRKKRGFSWILSSEPLVPYPTAEKIN